MTCEADMRVPGGYSGGRYFLTALRISSRTNALRWTRCPGFDSSMASLSNASDSIGVIVTCSFTDCFSIPFGFRLIRTPHLSGTTWTFSCQCCRFDIDKVSSLRHTLIMGNIKTATNTASTHWALPVTLLDRFGAIRGRYATEQAARAAAKRAGIELAPKARPATLSLRSI